MSAGRPHPFDCVETITAEEDDLRPELGNDAYYDWIQGTIEAGTRKPVPWLAVRLAIVLDRMIRTHEAESTGGPLCKECIALKADS